MIRTKQPSQTQVISDRLLDRMAMLGVTVAVAGAEGCLMPLGEMCPVEKMIIHAPAFIASVRRHWVQLREQPGQAVRVWPGIWLVSMPNERRRRILTQNDNVRMAVAMLFDQDLLDSEHFHLLCDQQQMDFKATLQRFNRDQLLSHHEVQRLASSLGWMQQDSIELDRRVHELQAMSQQLAESYEELSLMYKLSSNMMVNQTPVTFLQDACSELQQVVGLQWMALQITNHDFGLRELAGRTFICGQPPAEEGKLKKTGLELISRIPHDYKTMVLEHPEELGIEPISQNGNLLVVPLSRKETPFGVIFGADKIDGTLLSSIDSKLCRSLAGTMSIFLQNAMLFEDMQLMFMGTMHALTSSIDAKDSYTHGHSERVALMSRMLADAAGLDPETCHRVYIAGLLHDVGKIGVPESVLCKPGRLTAEEFELIKQHPQIGARILKDIRQMQDLIPGVLYHHERWDGNGYPHKLAGEAIPLFGRLIGLADSFDAMSTNRTYRSALKHKAVIAEIEKCSGSQFDPQLARIFVKLDFSLFFEMVVKHQAAFAEEGSLISQDDMP